MKKSLVFLFFLQYLTVFSQTTLDPNNVDHDLLNQFILKEVNEVRKKEKVAVIYNEKLLLPAAEDHAAYMHNKSKITHFQRSKEKRSPKNRVDYYGQQFSRVGENVQVNGLNNIPKELKLKPQPSKIESYEVLAKVLVLSWKNSPPHFKNMISPEYTTTFTSIKIGTNGEIYACQLFGSDAYSKPEDSIEQVYDFKPENPKKCRRCYKNSSVGGNIFVDKDSIIVYAAESKKDLRKSVIRPWSDAIAADIVLKSQYPCDTNSVFNGYAGIRGVPLSPVFRKDFKKGENSYRRKGVYIELGKVPNWINEDFEINLSIINKKRTCVSTIFHTISASIDLDIALALNLDSTYKDYLIEKRSDTLSLTVKFDRSAAQLKDSTIYSLISSIEQKLNSNTRAVIHGFSSIEGSKEENAKLYALRADVLKKALIEKGCDSNSITIITEENFKDFRKDIKGTPFAYLGNYNDEEIRSKLMNRSLRDSLEYLLKNHRYAKVNFTLKWNDTIPLNRDNAKRIYDEFISKENVDGAFNVLSFVYNSVIYKSLEPAIVDSFNIPGEKRFVKALYQRSLLKNSMSNDSLRRRDEFKNELVEQLELDPKNIQVNTHLLLLAFEELEYFDFESTEAFYKMLTELNNVDPTIRARILLKVATEHDIINFIFNQGRPYLYLEMDSWVRPARLSVDELFQLASFYTFFNLYRTAFDMIKNLIDDTHDPDHLVFFLKLIGLDDLGVPHKKYLMYFSKIRELTGSDFCTYFNSPRLNFQILDDNELKKIYCKECL